MAPLPTPLALGPPTTAAASTGNDYDTSNHSKYSLYLVYVCKGDAGGLYRRPMCQRPSWAK